MNPKVHEKITPEAHEMFEQLLVTYYKKSYEESYQILRGKIKVIFRSKDTNRKYRSILIADLEDLTLAVIFRLMSINSKSLKEKGERIRDLESMVNKIADFVYKEELRAIRKRLNEQPIDKNDSESKTLSIAQRKIDDEIQTIKNEIVRKCYEACVEKLPAESKALLRAYYPNVILTPKELVVMRKRLANEAAGLTQAQAQSQTPRQEARTLNNLQSKVNKLRKRLIEECVRECVAAKEARHLRLNYLKQQ
jgi:hypothetical protein